ncbi:MAG: META domain-containing protein [Litorimonas sp.]
MSFYLFSIVVLFTSGCSDSKVPDATIPDIGNAPASLEREINSQLSEVDTSNKDNLIPKYSALIGKWDIVRFNDYEPTRISMNGKNQAYVQFSEGYVGFQMECNSAGMPTELSAKGVLKNKGPFDGIMATQMECGVAKQEREERLFSFFANEPQILPFNEKTLRLVGTQQELILRKREIMPSDLNGVWQLQYVDGVIALYPARPRYDHLTFRIGDNESSVIGYDGCNRIGTQVKFEGLRIRMKNSKQQLRECAEGLKRTSGAYYELMIADGNYEVDGPHLLINSNGKRYDLIRLDEQPRRPMPVFERREAPAGTKLCEVRAPLPNETFPDYPPPTQALGGYTVRVTDDAIYFDHQDFLFGSTALSELSTPILFEKEGQITVVKRISNYPTRLNFGETGIYCSAEGQ